MTEVKVSTPQIETFYYFNLYYLILKLKTTDDQFYIFRMEDNRFYPLVAPWMFSFTWVDPYCNNMIIKCYTTNLKIKMVKCSLHYVDDTYQFTNIEDINITDLTSFYLYIQNTAEYVEFKFMSARCNYHFDYGGVTHTLCISDGFCNSHSLSCNNSLLIDSGYTRRLYISTINCMADIKYDYILPAVEQLTQELNQDFKDTSLIYNFVKHNIVTREVVYLIYKYQISDHYYHFNLIGASWYNFDSQQEVSRVLLVEKDIYQEHKISLSNKYELEAILTGIKNRIFLRCSNNCRHLYLEMGVKWYLQFDGYKKSYYYFYDKLKTDIILNNGTFLSVFNASISIKFTNAILSLRDWSQFRDMKYGKTTFSYSFDKTEYNNKYERLKELLMYSTRMNVIIPIEICELIWTQLFLNHYYSPV